jgi:hypothetical protein
MVGTDARALARLIRSDSAPTVAARSASPPRAAATSGSSPRSGAAPRASADLFSTTSYLRPVRTVGETAACLDAIVGVDAGGTEIPDRRPLVRRLRMVPWPRAPYSHGGQSWAVAQRHSMGSSSFDLDAETMRTSRDQKNAERPIVFDQVYGTGLGGDGPPSRGREPRVGELALCHLRSVHGHAEPRTFASRGDVPEVKQTRSRRRAP